ncbi:MAG: hypothetical protein FWD02_04455 [Bacteroidales bacterium]|nr:hypothetical protein [Bacteroidales bacterium]
MLGSLNVPNLKTIGGTLYLIGQESVSEDNFPKLETIGGDIHLALSGFTKLPDSLLSVAGNVYIIQEPESLVQSCLAKQKAGIIKGNVILVGGKISSTEEGKIEYGESYILS